MTTLLLKNRNSKMDHLGCFVFMEIFKTIHNHLPSMETAIFYICFYSIFECFHICSSTYELYIRLCANIHTSIIIITFVLLIDLLPHNCTPPYIYLIIVTRGYITKRMFPLNPSFTNACLQCQFNEGMFYKG